MCPSSLAKSDGRSFTVSVNICNTPDVFPHIFEVKAHDLLNEDMDFSVFTSVEQNGNG